MEILKNISLFISNFDLFSAQALLRYKNDEKKSTKTGGCVTLIFIATMLFVLYNTAVSIANRENIYVISYT